MTTGVLSTLDNPTLPFIVGALRAHGVHDTVIILDEKAFSAKDRAIWLERTGSAFEMEAGLGMFAFENAAPPCYFVRNHNNDACLALIKRLGLACLANAGTPRKLRKEILDSVAHGVINVHPGMLPDYRGCSCVEWAIYNDDKVGNTAHFMTEGYDEGPIIVSESYDFPKDIDYQSIRVRTYREGFALMGKAVVAVLREGMTPAGGIQQVGGTYWNPIPPDKMDDVLRKVATRRYRYACL